MDFEVVDLVTLKMNVTAGVLGILRDNIIDVC